MAGDGFTFLGQPTGTTSGTVAAGNHTHTDPNLLEIGESTVPRHTANTASAVSTTSGNLRLTYFTATKTETTTQIRVGTGTTAAGATPTLCRLGLYTVAGSGDITLVASTANDTTLFANINTAYTKAWQVAYPKVAGVRYAIGLLVVSGAATPTLNGCALSSAAEGAIAPRLTGNVGSQTDLPASVAAGSISTTVVCLYAVLLP